MDISSYIVHRIPKRDGSLRIIHEPLPELKLRQRQILRWLMARGISAGKYAHGFVRGRSTATNAAVHVGRRVVLKADIADFFGSTSARMVKKALLAEGVPAEPADEIVEVCTLDRCLPQGAPTSPFLANIAAKAMDRRLAGLAKKYGATYSRYADDLCFSSDNPRLNHILPALEYVVRKCGYGLNEKKTSVMRSGGRQIVTGLVVNCRVHVPRELRRNVRAGLHRLRISLFDGVPFENEKFVELRGMLAYFAMVRPDLAPRYNSELKEVKRLVELRERLVAA